METHQLSAMPSVLWSSQPMFHPLGALQSFFPGLFLKCKTLPSDLRSFFRVVDVAKDAEPVEAAESHVVR